MSQYILGEQEARDQIEKFCEWYDIDLEESAAIAKEQNLVGYELTRNRLEKAFRRGRLEVIEQEHPKFGTTLVVKQYLQHPIAMSKDGRAADQKEIVYREVTGATKANVKIAKDANDTKALFATLAVLSGEPEKVFESLRGGDIGVAQLFGFLFLQI